MATPRTQANTELEPLVCYCRVAQHHWLSLFKHTRTQTRNESADSHAEIRLGAKKRNSQPSFLPASTVTPKPRSSAKHRVSARLHHIGALLLRPPVRAGLLCELARSPGETLTTSTGRDTQSCRWTPPAVTEYFSSGLSQVRLPVQLTRAVSLRSQRTQLAAAALISAGKSCQYEGEIWSCMWKLPTSHFPQKPTVCRGWNPLTRP